MKHLVMLSAMLFVSINFVFGQTSTALDAVDVPTKVLQAFNKNKAIEDVSWTKEGNSYKASFFDEDEYIYLTMFFNAEGTWTQTSKEITEEALPANIKELLKKDFKNNEILYVTMESFPSKKEYRLDLETEDSVLVITVDENAKVLSKTSVAKTTDEEEYEEEEYRAD